MEHIALLTYFLSSIKDHLSYIGIYKSRKLTHISLL